MNKPLKMSNTARLPLVLRREKFGGILFDPADASHLELDQEAFALAYAWMVKRRLPTTDAEKNLLRKIITELPALGDEPRPLRLCETSALPLGPYRHATVLAAPTLVDLQITRRCLMGCPHCYVSAEAAGEHMSFSDAQIALDEITSAGICQLAIGGGEPLLHPQFSQILKYAYRRGLVPNVTTTGQGLTQELLDSLANYCGAVALSLEGIGEGFNVRRRSGFDFFQNTLEQLFASQISTVLQITLSAENIEQLPQIVEYCLKLPQLYGVIFLAYKPVGRGINFNKPLFALDEKTLYPLLRQAFLSLSDHTRVGYDCCLTPSLAGLEQELGFSAGEVLEGCSAGRTSVGISYNLDVVPCTFMPERPWGNLHHQRFLDIWSGIEADKFRQRLDKQVDEKDLCRECVSRQSCLGGCPEWNLARCTINTPKELNNHCSE